MSVRLPEQIQIMSSKEQHLTTVRPQDVLCNNIIFPGEYNPHNVRPWLISITISNTGGPQFIVWASDEQDALDEAADNGMLDCIALDDRNADERVVHEDDCPSNEPELDPKFVNQCCNSWENFARLGNAGEPFDLDNVHMEALDLDSQSKQFMMLLAEARGANVERLSDL